MPIKRVPSQGPRSAEHRDRLKAVREHYQRERPNPKDLVASGDAEPTVPQRQFIAVHALVAALRQERERQGLSLTDVSERSGIERSMISRLENGRTINPTLETLFRYAHALGKELGMSLNNVETLDSIAKP